MYTECVISIASYFSKAFYFSLWERVYLQVGVFFGVPFFYASVFCLGKGTQEDKNNNMIPRSGELAF